MRKKYTVEYSLEFRQHSPPERHQYFTDDPRPAGSLCRTWWNAGWGFTPSSNEGADLPKADFDRIVTAAAAEVASRLICTTFNIKGEEERHRFGFAA